MTLAFGVQVLLGSLLPSGVSAIPLRPDIVPVLSEIVMSPLPPEESAMSIMRTPLLFDAPIEKRSVAASEESGPACSDADSARLATIPSPCPADQCMTSQEGNTSIPEKSLAFRAPLAPEYPPSAEILRALPFLAGKNIARTLQPFRAPQISTMVLRV